MSNALLEAVQGSLRSEGDAYRALEQVRWCDGAPTCPHCGGERTYYIAPLNGSSRRTRGGGLSERRVWVCGTCRLQFSVLTGSVLYRSKLSIRAVVTQVVAPLHIRGLMRQHDVCGTTARRLMDTAESIRTQGLIQVRPTDAAVVLTDDDGILDDARMLALQGFRVLPLDALVGDLNAHEAFSVDGTWDDPTFDAAVADLHESEIEMRRTLWEWNLDHRQVTTRPFMPGLWREDPDDPARIKFALSGAGMTGRKHARHRGRAAASMATRGKRPSKKQKGDR